MKLYKVGRFLLGSFFVYNGINHFLKRKAIAQYASAKHVPSRPPP